MTLKKVFESDEWIIKKALQGVGQTRIDAVRRFPRADRERFFSKWGSTTYINQLSREKYGKNIDKLHFYYY